MNLYSYADSWHNKVHAKTLWKTIRHAYIIRSLSLLLALPFDIFYILLVVISGKKYDCFFATEKWPDLIAAMPTSVSIAIIAPPTYFFKWRGKNLHYMPASVFYIIATLGLLSSKSNKFYRSVQIIKIISILLKKITIDNAKIVVHSDALPFGRSLVLAFEAINCTTICIQHGTFRSYNKIDEQDGFLCKINIVRSQEDAEIIRNCNKKTKIYVLKEFFQIELTKSNRAPTNTKPIILLIGEGFHIIDEQFNTLYLDYLSNISHGIENAGMVAVFRPHPSERNVSWNSRFLVIDKSPLNEILNRIDCVIGYSSTLLQECAEIGIPSYYIKVNDKTHVIKGRNNVKIELFSNLENSFNKINNYFLNKKNKTINHARTDKYKIACALISSN